MKRNTVCKYSLLLIVCGVFALQCKKAEPDQFSYRFQPDTVRVQTTPNTFCSTWVCMTLPEDMTKKWIGQPSDQGLSDGASISIGPIVYFGGGSPDDGYDSGKDEVIGFNLETEQRNWLQNLSIGRSHLAAAAAGHKVLFAGGKYENVYNRGNPNFYDVVDIFDQQSGSRTTSKLSLPRAHLSATSIGSKAYFIGGLIKAGKSTSRIDVYDDTDEKWIFLEAPRPRAFAGAVAYQHKIYIAGGMDPEKAGSPIFTVDVLDTQSGLWTTIEAPHEHPHASVVLADQKIFIAGGDGLNNKYLDIYDVANNNWTFVELTDSRFDMAVAVMYDRIIFLGGSFLGDNPWSGNYSNAIDIYLIDKKIWIQGKLNVGVGGVLAGAWANRSIFSNYKFRVERGDARSSLMWILNK